MHSHISAKNDLTQQVISKTLQCTIQSVMPANCFAIKIFMILGILVIVGQVTCL